MDPRVTELHCIMPMVNVASVLAHGILSHEKAAELPHSSVAKQIIQDRRDQKVVPGGLRLHQYANLYFCARNPMLFLRLSHAANICVLSVDVKVIDRTGVVFADQNAASDYVRFLHPSQWKLINFDDVFAESWKHPDDQIAEWRHKSRKCAEVLVPNSVPSQFLRGAYVIDEAAKARLTEAGCTIPVKVNGAMYFREPKTC